MHAEQLCQKYFDNTPTTFHGSRKTALKMMTSSLLCDAQLGLTSLGRHLPGDAYVKHKIKRVDRFLGNHHVYHELPVIYGEMLAPLLSGLERLVIAVDWSGCCTPDYHVLRASLLHAGRAIPLYNVVVPEALQEAPEVHDALLETLKYQVLPEQAEVVVVTDGGFKTPWLEKVESLGWDYVARMRGQIHCQLEEGNWQPVEGLHARAGGQARYLGEGLLGKTSESQCVTHFFTIKHIPKGRRNPAPQYPEQEARYEQLHREPWVIVSSLEGGRQIARQIINYYGKRMQIEQNFRDDKNPRWGFAWRYSRTRDVARISILCLIATLATLLLWMIGFAAEQAGLSRRFQANTVKDKQVLSYLYLAKQVLRHYPERVGRYGWISYIDFFNVHYHRQLEAI